MNKFNAISSGGYRSKAENLHSLWLRSEIRAKRIVQFKYEVSYDLFAWTSQLGKSEKVFIGKHKPDFTVEFPNGCIEVHEVKGGNATKTEAWNLRKKIFEANYPHILYKVFDKFRY